MADETIQFSIKNENDEEMKKILLEVYKALNEKGYNSLHPFRGSDLYHHPQQCPQPCQKARQRRATAEHG